MAGPSAKRLAKACLLAGASVSGARACLCLHGGRQRPAGLLPASSYSCSLSSQPREGLPAGSPQRSRWGLWATPEGALAVSWVLMRLVEDGARSSPLAHAWGHVGGRSSP